MEFLNEICDEQAIPFENDMYHEECFTLNENDVSINFEDSSTDIELSLGFSGLELDQAFMEDDTEAAMDYIHEALASEQDQLFHPSNLTTEPIPMAPTPPLQSLGDQLKVDVSLANELSGFSVNQLTPPHSSTSTMGIVPMQTPYIPHQSGYTAQNSFAGQQMVYYVGRRQSISKIPLAQLYQMMGLAHDHDTARDREERIMKILSESGFKVGVKTWIRDTDEPFRREVVDKIFHATKNEFGYSKNMIEAIIRRGTYARMQSNLRRKRRRASRIQQKSFVSRISD